MKRSPALRALSSEHHMALVLAKRAATAAASNDISLTWSHLSNYFETVLEPHFRQEEELLLPALALAGETLLVNRTRAEHAQLRHLVYSDARNPENLRAFAELLQAHIRFEERELFMTVQERLAGFSNP